MLVSSFLIVSALQGVFAYPGSVHFINPTQSRLNCNGASLNGYCCDGSIIDPSAGVTPSENKNDLSDLVCCTGDSNHHIYTGSDSPSTCSGGTAIPLTQVGSTSSANREASDPSSAISTSVRPTADATHDTAQQDPPPTQLNLTSISRNWKSTSISRSDEYTSPGVVLAVLRMMCHASRKVVGIGGAIVRAFYET